MAVFHVTLRTRTENSGGVNTDYLYPTTVDKDVKVPASVNNSAIPNPTNNADLRLSDIISALGPFAFLSGPTSATTTRAGIVQLNDAIDSDSTTTAATANAVKTVNDRVTGVINNFGGADGNVVKIGDSIATYSESGSDRILTFSMAAAE